jgi:heme O synthase-like polyprenyltransferase
MAGAALIFGLANVAAGFFVFAGLVTVASFLNGVFGFCAGCEIYLLLKRATTKAA